MDNVPFELKMRPFHLSLGVLAACLLLGLTFEFGAAERRNLEAAAGSPEELVRNFLDALADNDIRAVRRLAISKDEFITYVWPDLPAAAPERNLTPEFVWNTMNIRSLSNLGQLMDTLGGRRLKLGEIRFTGEVTEYGTFRVHRDSQLVLQDENGEIQTGRLFGSVLELDDQFKIFSFNN